MPQPAEDGAREVRPFSLGFESHDADFMPRVVSAEEDEADPKASSVPEPADFSDTVPILETEMAGVQGRTEQLAVPATAPKVITPPKVPAPGKPAS